MCFRRQNSTQLVLLTKFVRRCQCIYNKTIAQQASFFLFRNAIKKRKNKIKKPLPATEIFRKCADIYIFLSILIRKYLLQLVSKDVKLLCGIRHLTFLQHQNSEVYKSPVYFYPSRLQKGKQSPLLLLCIHILFYNDNLHQY